MTTKTTTTTFQLIVENGMEEGKFYANWDGQIEAIKNGRIYVITPCGERDSWPIDMAADANVKYAVATRPFFKVGVSKV